MAEVGINSRRNAIPRLSGENKDRLDKADIRLAKSGMPSNHDLIKLLDNKAARQGKKADAFPLSPSSQAPSLLQFKDVLLSTAADLRWTVPKPILTQSGVSSRTVSPFSRKSSPPRSATPVPTTSGLSFSKSVAARLKKTNDLLNQEVSKLRGQVQSVRHQCEIQESELQKSTKKAQEATVLAAEESAKFKAAKDVISSLTSQLKDMAERLPPGAYDLESMRLPNDLEPNGVLHHADTNGEDQSRSNLISSSYLVSPMSTASASMQYNGHGPESMTSNSSAVRVQMGNNNYLPEAVESKRSVSSQDGDGFKPRNPMSAGNTTTTANLVEAEWIEQYEPGVYITLMALRDGTRDLKRVRFSRRRFGEQQAESWWSENREKVYERYNVGGSYKSSVSSQIARKLGDTLAPPAVRY